MGHRRLQNFALIALSTFPLLLAGAVSGVCQEGAQEDITKQKLENALAIVRNAELRESDPERVIEAIQQLGQLRDPSAIEDLAGLLTFRKWAPWEKDPNEAKDVSMPRSRGMIYPAVNALMEIGGPSVPAMVEVIASHDPNSLETQNAMEVLIYLSRDKRKEYVQQLREEATKATSAEDAERLRKASERLEKTKR